MSLWHRVELCRLSLPLKLKCFWMLPLITYKHLNTLPVSINHDWQIMVCQIQRQHLRWRCSLRPQQEGQHELKVTFAWDWGIYRRLSWGITKVPLLVFNPWLWMGHLNFGSGQEVGNIPPQPSHRTAGGLKVPELCSVPSCVCTHKELRKVWSSGTWQHEVLLFLQKGKENLDQTNLIPLSCI